VDPPTVSTTITRLSRSISDRLRTEAYFDPSGLKATQPEASDTTSGDPPLIGIR
jgi:hypothetical protein